MGYYMAIFGDHEILKKIHKSMIIRAKSLKEAEKIVLNIYPNRPTYIMNVTGIKTHRIK